jgi:hypothetical protein
MPELDSGTHERDAKLTMRIERIDRPDGRYLIYYSWPDQRQTDREPEEPDARGATPDV